MSQPDTINAYIIETQIELFEDAKSDLQISFAEMSRRAGLLDEHGKPNGTLKAWAIGQNALSLWGIKKLLRVKGNDGEPGVLAPYLSRLFEPEEYALIGYATGTDHDDLAGLCRDYLATKDAAHHPDSPAGRDIAPCEDATLRAKVVPIRERAA